MDGFYSTVAQDQNNQPQRWNRLQAASVLQAYEGCPEDLSQRQFAQQHQVPRSTLQGWLRRRQQLDLDPELARFLEQPAGVTFLHRLLIAAHVAFVQHGGCGTRKVSEFLHLAGLDQVVASSYGSQQQFVAAMSDEIVAYGKQQQQQLAVDLPPRQIAVGEDETYHPQICLVAAEPVSGFILVEMYASHRDADTWEQALRQGLTGLSVEVVQMVSDEAKGLLAHAARLGAHHSPDVFHVQQELSQATSAALAGQTRRAEQASAQARQQAEQQAALAQACRSQCGESAAAEELAAHAAAAAQHAAQAEQQAQACRQREERAGQARRGVSQAYHPFDGATGAARQPQEVQQQLEAQFDELERVAEEAHLSAACHERIAKARRLVLKMAATILFFWQRVYLQLDGLSLTPEVERSLLEELLPAQYLERAAAQAPTAERRAALREVAQRLQGLARDGPMKDLPDQERLALEQQATVWADLFQRSSSCVEGRNGQLRLWHHSLPRLSSQRLAALTVLHNYYLRRADGTTAAERFFGAEPDDLMDWLMRRLPFPSRPAPRPKAA